MISADIVDGKIAYEPTETYKKATKLGDDTLGKDAFMQLLVTQLQYQDPLNPSSDTEFIGQLAQFTSLEEMQNMTSSLNNQSALGLVGRNVILNVGSSTGSSTTSTVAGYVQYVKMVDGKAQLAINDELYSYDDLQYVIDEAYLSNALEDEANSKKENNTDDKADSKENSSN